MMMVLTDSSCTMPMLIAMLLRTMGMLIAMLLRTTGMLIAMLLRTVHRPTHVPLQARRAGGRARGTWTQKPPWLQWCMVLASKVEALLPPETTAACDVLLMSLPLNTPLEKGGGA